MARTLRSDADTRSSSGSTHSQLIAAHLYGDDGLMEFITGIAAAPLAVSARMAVTASTGPAMLGVSVEGPAVALVEQASAPGLSTGVTAGLIPVIDLPESDLTVAGGRRTSPSGIRIWPTLAVARCECG